MINKLDSPVKMKVESLVIQTKAPTTSVSPTGSFSSRIMTRMVGPTVIGRKEIWMLKATDAANLPLPDPAFLYLRAKIAMIGDIPGEYESSLGFYPSSS